MDVSVSADPLCVSVSSPITAHITMCDGHYVIHHPSSHLMMNIDTDTDTPTVTHDDEHRHRHRHRHRHIHHHHTSITYHHTWCHIIMHVSVSSQTQTHPPSHMMMDIDTKNNGHGCFCVCRSTTTHPRTCTTTHARTCTTTHPRTSTITHVRWWTMAMCDDGLRSCVTLVWWCLTMMDSIDSVRHSIDSVRLLCDDETPCPSSHIVYVWWWATVMCDSCAMMSHRVDGVHHGLECCETDVRGWITAWTLWPIIAYGVHHHTCAMMDSISQQTYTHTHTHTHTHITHVRWWTIYLNIHTHTHTHTHTSHLCDDGLYISTYTHTHTHTHTHHTCAMIDYIDSVVTLSVSRETSWMWDICDVKPLWFETSLMCNCLVMWNILFDPLWMWDITGVTQDVRPLDVRPLLWCLTSQMSHITGEVCETSGTSVILSVSRETSLMWDICDPLCVAWNLSDVRPLWCVTVWSCETSLSMMMDSIITLYMSTTFCDDTWPLCLSCKDE